jgi:hypothetical protein
MNDRRALLDLRINVLPADEVGVWHCILRLALELDRRDAPLRSSRLGCFDYVAADGRTGRFTPELMAQVFALPPALVASAVSKLLELGILERDGQSLSIVDAADWFVPLTEHPPLSN